MELTDNKDFYSITTVLWEDSHKYSPAPRHRRRLILKMIKNLDFSSIMDVGCAQPFLLEYFNNKGKKLYGCDISSGVIKRNKEYFKEAQFEELDISKEKYKSQDFFDLIVCSEVLEHIDDWKSAVRNLSEMTKKYLIITVPCGKVHKIDKMMGHVRHFSDDKLINEIEKNNFKIIKNRKWGFPFHTIYKYAINFLNPEKMYNDYTLIQYNHFQIFISNIIYFLFFINDIFLSGSQLLILAEKKDAK